VGFEIDRDPNLVGVLRGQAVEAQRRQKANDTARNEFTRYRKAMILRNGRIGESVHAARRPNQDALPVKAQQSLPGDPASLHVARAD
jgi:hypothetical protein